MEKTLEKVRQEVLKSKETYFVCWSGVYFDTIHRFIRTDKLFMNVLVKKNNAVSFRRLVAIPKETPAKEDYLEYSLRSCYRIMEGPRKGLVVDSRELAEDDVFQVVGLHKKLIHGKAPGMFHKKRAGDKILIPMLRNVFKARHVESLREVLPDYYLTCTPGNKVIYLRHTGVALHYLEGFSQYDPDATPSHNLREMREELETEAGHERVAYPFDIVYGRGVKAACISNRHMSFGKWYKLDNFELNLPHIKVVE